MVAASKNMRSIDSLPIFNEMLSCEYAIVYLHVSWSMQAMDGHRIVEDFEESNRDNVFLLGLGVTVWRIDVSDQEGSIWNAVRFWLEPQTELAGSLMWSGAGSLVWCSQGRVRDVELSTLSITSLLDRTVTAFHSM